MTFTVQGYRQPLGDPLYYSDGFLLLFEDHIDILKKSPNTQQLPIAADLAARFQYNFMGLLHFLKPTPPFAFHLLMRLNGLSTPDQFDVGFDTLLVPNEDEIERLRQAYLRSYAE
jgi:hypothetical protein